MVGAETKELWSGTVGLPLVMGEGVARSFPSYFWGLFAGLCFQSG